MTWIRLETDFPRHKLIGLLADKLRMDRDRAAMCLIRIWCAFGELEPDGKAVEIPDSTLEDWAGWKGPRGRFALVFREYCLEPTGTIRGWWRQEKLLQRQEEKRKRPSQSQRVRQKSGKSPAPDNDRTNSGQSAGNVDDNGTTTTDSPRANGRLIGRLAGDPDRFGVMALFDHLPPEENPEAWSAVLLGCLDGLGLEQGKSATVRQLAAACNEYPAVAKSGWNPRHFKACVERVMHGKPRSGSKAEATIDTAQKWVEGAA